MDSINRYLRCLNVALALLTSSSCTQVPQDKNGGSQRGVSEETSSEEENTSASAMLDKGEKGVVETLMAKIKIKAGSFAVAVKVYLEEVSKLSIAKSFTSVSKAQSIKITSTSGGKVNEVALAFDVSLQYSSSSGNLWVLIIKSDGKKGLVLAPEVSGAIVTFSTKITEFTAIAIKSLGEIPSDIDFTVDPTGVETPYTSTDTSTATSTPTATAKVALAAPATPTSTFGNAQNTLTWTAVTGAASYKIFYKTSTGVASSDSFLTSTTNSKTHTGLTNGTTYYYKVAAVDSDGTVGTLSAEFSAMPAGPTLNFGTLPSLTAGISFTLTVEIWMPTATAILTTTPPR